MFLLLFLRVNSAYSFIVIVMFDKSHCKGTGSHQKRCLVHFCLTMFCCYIVQCKLTD